MVIFTMDIFYNKMSKYNDILFMACSCMHVCERDTYVYMWERETGSSGFLVDKNADIINLLFILTNTV